MNDTLLELTNKKNILELYHQELEKNKILDINIYLNSLVKGTYKSFYSEKLKIKNILYETEEIFEKVNKIKDSKIFRIFYIKKKDIKELKDSKSLFNEAYDQFNQFKIEIAAKGADLINNSSSKGEIFNIIEQNYNDPDIQKEINSFIYGKGKDDEELNLIWNGKKYENDLDAMLYFLNYFQKIKDEISNLKIKLNNLRDKKNSDKMKNVLKELKDTGFYDYTKESNNKIKSNYIQLFHYFNGKINEFSEGIGLVNIFFNFL